MKRFLITENEKSEILNLYKKFKLTEDTGCPCEDGSVDVSCCKETKIDVEETEKEMVLKAKMLVQRQEEIDSERLEKEKKEKIADVQKRLDQTYNDVMSKQKMDRFQKQAINKRIKSLESELKSLEGSSSSGPEERSADEKVSAWVSIATSLLSLCTTLISAIKTD